MCVGYPPSEGPKGTIAVIRIIAYARSVGRLTSDAWAFVRCCQPGIRSGPQGIRYLYGACVLAVLAGGCASTSEQGPDLGSPDTIGIVLPEEFTAPRNAEDLIRLYNLTESEDTAKNVAVGAGTGAATGMALGAAVACLATPCGGLLFPAILVMAAGGGLVLGGTTGAVAGATVDSQEQVEVAPVHLHAVNKVLPSLQRDYLIEPRFEERVLRRLHRQNPDYHFSRAVRDGGRYRLEEAVASGARYTDVNLVLSEFQVFLAGKAENEPQVGLNIRIEWALTRYDAPSETGSALRVLSGAYQSEKHPLSEWLADDGALLKRQVNEGLEASLTHAFSDLTGERKEQEPPGFHADDAF